MQNLKSQLPPLNSLVAFEATARLLSITKAAQELFVSREAVSRQIRILEDHLGVKLFYRLYRALELTDDGTGFYETVQGVLAELAQKSLILRQRQSTGKLTISASVAIASYWLTVPLRKFREKNPDVEVQVIASDDPVDMISRGVNVSLRYGEGNWPDVDSIFLFEGQTYPVCSPDYYDRHGPIAGPEDLLDHTLLNLDRVYAVPEDWYWWLQCAGVEAPKPAHFLHFNAYNVVIQATLDGQGVALGFGGILDDLIARKRLMKAIDLTYTRRRALYLTLPKRIKPSPEVASFILCAKGQAV